MKQLSQKTLESFHMKMSLIGSTSLLLCLLSAPATAANSSRLNISTDSKIGYAKTISSEVQKNRPAHEKNENDPEPIENLAKKAYPATEALTNLLMNGSFDRNDALLVVRAVEDLLTIDASASGGMIMADLRKKPSTVALMKECALTRATEHVAAKSSAVLDHQEILTNAGLHLITQKEVCDFKDLMSDLDRLEREGNG